MTSLLRLAPRVAARACVTTREHIQLWAAPPRVVGEAVGELRECWVGVVW
jgi:hypothetical protein